MTDQAKRRPRRPRNADQLVNAIVDVGLRPGLGPSVRLGHLLRKDQSPQPPFAKHKRYYLFIKIAVLVIAVLLAVQYFA